jgi:hypothetical protein
MEHLIGGDIAESRVPDKIAERGQVEIRPPIVLLRFRYGGEKCVTREKCVTPCVSAVLKPLQATAHIFD